MHGALSLQGPGGCKALAQGLPGAHIERADDVAAVIGVDDPQHFTHPHLKLRGDDLEAFSGIEARAGARRDDEIVVGHCGRVSYSETWPGALSAPARSQPQNEHRHHCERPESDTARPGAHLGSRAIDVGE